MGTVYEQLTLGERYQIQQLNELGWSARAIGRLLCRSNKTISRELKRLPSDYLADSANDLAVGKRKQATKRTCWTAELWKQVEWMLELDFSPEQIAHRLRVEQPGTTLGVQTIYRWLYKMNLGHLLPRRGKPYRKRPSAGAGAHLIPNRVDIDERPSVVDSNTELGHWEADTVHATDGYFVTVAERKTKLYLFKKVKNKSKAHVTKALISTLKPYASICKTITFDNGGEFAGHEKITKTLKCDCYFAKPYHSWQRGLNENSNGLLRRYVPKGTGIQHLKPKDIKEMELKINMRPRKSLGYLTPYEYLSNKRVSLMLGI